MAELIREFLERLGPWSSPAALVLGILALLAGGHWLVNGAVRVAQRLGVSTLLIGLTVVAFGTSAPELSFNITAAISGHGELSFGNVVGSNIANIALVLGASAIIVPLLVHSRVIRKELPLLVLVTAGMLGLGWLGAEHANSRPILYTFSRIDGLIMVSGFLIMAGLWYRLGQQDRADPLLTEAADEARNAGRGAMVWGLFLVFIGLAALVLGGKITEIGAVRCAAMMGMSEALIGLTIVAVATSLPELITCVIACRKGHADLAVGNIVGSNLFNILLVLGLTATVSSVPIPEGRGWFDLIWMMGLTIVLVPICLTTGRRILKLEGILLLISYAAYLGLSVWLELR